MQIRRVFEYVPISKQAFCRGTVKMGSIIYLFLNAAIADCENLKTKEFVVNDIFANKSIVAVALPESEEIIDIELNEFYPKNSLKLSKRQFKELFSNAKSITPDDQILKEWHYAPWYRGSFKTKHGTYKFKLYLGGLGFLTNPRNDMGAFLLKM